MASDKEGSEIESERGGAESDFLVSLAKAKALAANFTSSNSSGDKNLSDKRQVSQSSPRGRSVSPKPAVANSQSSGRDRERSRSRSPPSTEVAKPQQPVNVQNSTQNAAVGYMSDAVVALGEVIIPNNMVGYVIGKGGENIKRIINETGCKVQFDPVSDSPVRRAVLFGRRGARVEQAKLLLQQLAAEKVPQEPRMNSFSDQSQYNDGSGVENMPVEQCFVGLVIGKGGETIRSIAERSSCKVYFAPETERDASTGSRLLRIIGSPESIAAAKQIVSEIIPSNSQNGAPTNNHGNGANPSGAGYSRAPSVQETLIVPLELAGKAIGKGGEVIKAIGREFRCYCRALPMDDPQTVQNPGKRIFVLSGQQSSVEQAKARIISIVSEVDNHGGQGHQHHHHHQHHHKNYSYNQGNESDAQQQQFSNSSAYTSSAAYTIDTGATQSMHNTPQQPQANSAAWEEYYKKYYTQFSQGQTGEADANDGTGAGSFDASQYAQNPYYNQYLQYYQNLYQQQQDGK